MPRLRDLKKEIFKILLLDGRNNITDIVEIDEGTVTQATPFIREIISYNGPHNSDTMLRYR